MLLYADDIKLAEAVAMKTLLKGGPRCDIHGYNVEWSLAWEAPSGIKICIIPIGNAPINILAFVTPFSLGRSMIDHSVGQLLLVLLGVLGTHTLSGKTGTPTTELFIATASVVPPSTAELMTIIVAHIAMGLLLAAAMLKLAAVMLAVMLMLMIMVSMDASHRPGM